MADIIGGTMMVVGGGAISVGSLTCVRGLIQRPIEVARDLLGDSAPAVPQVVPADLSALLDQIP